MNSFVLGLVLSLLPQDSSPAATEAATRRWTTRGYGYLLELEGDELRVFEHRAPGDLPLLTAERRSPDEAVFTTDGVAPIVIDDDGVRWGLTSHPVPLDPWNEPARVPTPEQRADPLFNYDWFCASFAEQYAFFELRGMDWEAATRRARGEMGPSSTPDELFEVLAGLIRPLEDGHCFVVADGRRASSSRPDPDPTARRRFAEFQSRIDQDYLQAEPSRAHDGDLAWAWLAEGVGYLRLDSMQSALGFEAGLASLDAGLDAAFAELEGMDGLVIDVRFNGGGADLFGFELAGRLIRERTLVVQKEVRSDPAVPGTFSTVGGFHVDPEGPAFTGAVTLLVSRYTASAAEVFGMALLAREPRVTIVGEASAAGFSDILVTQLPNGWEVGLSNEVYRTPAGDCFEGVGLPLDIEVPTLRVDDLEEGRDPALEAAVEATLSRD